MDYTHLRAYAAGTLLRELDAEATRVRDLDPSGVLSLLRTREIAAAIVMTRFRAEYSHLETRIKAGDGAEEELYFDVEERSAITTPMAMLTAMTGGRTVLLDVERVEMLGADLFIREVIAGRY